MINQGSVSTMSPRTSTPNLHQHVASVVCKVAHPEFRILDLGCGSGALLERLALLGYQHLTGIDISPPPSSSVATYQQADLDHFILQEPAHSFDLALVVEVIEHIENPGLFLTELARLLKPGGLALFTTPNLHSAQAKLRFALADRLKQFDEKGDPTHITPIVLFPFTRLLNRHGFEEMQSWGYPEDGSSPTSRPVMRVAARLLRQVFRTRIAHGDNLCLLVQRSDVVDEAGTDAKVALLTAHYQLQLPRRFSGNKGRWASEVSCSCWSCDLSSDSE